MIKRVFYAWYDTALGAFRVSLLPPDAPVRPSAVLPSRADVMALATRKRATVHWWPPVPYGLA